jgi:hypothetical protein
MISSYAKNSLGEILLTYVKCFRPLMAVELGVLDGYSTTFIAQGLKINKERWGVNSHLDAYDLWDLYPYKHGNINIVDKLLIDLDLVNFVSLMQGDAFSVWQNYPDKSIHFLHVDISNTGEILRDIMALWDKKIYQGGIIAFEGGSQERDEVEWMRLYKKTSIKKELETNLIIKRNYIYATYLQFPSLTVLYKKFDYD